MHVLFGYYLLCGLIECNWDRLGTSTHWYWDHWGTPTSLLLGSLGYAYPMILGSLGYAYSVLWILLMEL